MSSPAVIECNYLLITDNLLDPSHVAWVHPSSFAGQGSDETARRPPCARTAALRMG